MDAKVSIKTKTMPVQNLCRYISFKSPVQGKVPIFFSFTMRTKEINKVYPSPTFQGESSFGGHKFMTNYPLNYEIVILRLHSEHLIT